MNNPYARSADDLSIEQEMAVTAAVEMLRRLHSKAATNVAANLSAAFPTTCEGEF